MPPRLSEPIKREVELDGQLYTVTLGPEGVHIAPKGKRKGHELSWRDLCPSQLSRGYGAGRRAADQAAVKMSPKPSAAA